jgi:hypothetical protein
MLGLKHILRFRWAVLISLAVVSWQVYDRFRPVPAEIDAPRQQIAEEACWRVAELLPSVTGPRKLAVMRLAEDENGYVTAKLRETIGRAGNFHVLADSLLVHVMKELGLQEKPAGDLDSAFTAARKADAQYLLDGEVHAFTSDRSQGRISLTATLYRVDNSQVIGEAMRIDLPGESQSWGGLKGVPLIFAWLLAVALLPFILYKVVKSALATESNGAILVMLLVLSVIDVLLAWGLVGLALNVFVLAGSFVLAMGANYGLLNWINNHK